MERKQYCVYNQTSECFLSLGVSFRSCLTKRIRGILRKKSGSLDEGCWIIDPKGFYTFGLFSARDVICLDERHNVVQLIEGTRMLRPGTRTSGISSVLSLPLNTIYSSQTQRGDRLVICAAEEMEFRLRSMPSMQHEDALIPQLELESSAQLQRSYLRLDQNAERRSSRRNRWPRLIAYNLERDGLAVHSVKDISGSGLYLITDDRWPLGSEVIMTLRRTDELSKSSRNPINVRLRVSRWGTDGVGLSFLQAGVEEAEMETLTAN